MHSVNANDFFSWTAHTVVLLDLVNGYLFFRILRTVEILMDVGSLDNSSFVIFGFYL